MPRGEILHHRQHLAGQFGIERRGDLVEQHQLGLHRQRAGDGDALLLAARELLGIGSALSVRPTIASTSAALAAASRDCFFTRVSASVMFRSTVRCGNRL